jgi:hypothetical protein
MNDAYYNSREARFFFLEFAAGTDSERYAICKIWTGMHPDSISRYRGAVGKENRRDHQVGDIPRTQKAQNPFQLSWNDFFHFTFLLFGHPFS